MLHLCEVYYHVARIRDEPTAERAGHLLATASVIVREDRDTAFWQAAGKMKAAYVRVSPADCFCVTLATRLGGEVLTADHHEFDALAPRVACPIRFIR